jgi:hypothetical protein
MTAQIISCAYRRENQPPPGGSRVGGAGGGMEGAHLMREGE